MTSCCIISSSWGIPFWSFRDAYEWKRLFISSSSIHVKICQISWLLSLDSQKVDMTFDNVAGSWRNFDIQLVSFEEKQKYWQKKQISTYKVLIHLVSLSCQFLVGGIPTPLKNMKVSWDDEIPNIWKNKKGSKPPTSHFFAFWIFTFVWIDYDDSLNCIQWRRSFRSLPGIHHSGSSAHVVALLSPAFKWQKRWGWTMAVLAI